MLKSRWRAILGLMIVTASAHAGQFYLFTSFSLPSRAQSALLQQARHFHIPVYLRGFKDNALKKTLQAFQDLKVDGGLLIDPDKFRHFGVSVIPTLIYESGQDREQIVGNITVSSMLRELCDNKVIEACQKLTEDEKADD